MDRAAMTPPLRLAVTIALLALVSMPVGAIDQARLAPAGGRASPDITVVPGSYGIAPSPPRLQDILAVNVTVINQGDADAASFTVAFFLNNTTTPLNRNSYQVTVNSLARGATANVSCTWDTRTTETVYFLSGINYTIIVIVDYNNRIAELDESNNRLDHNQTLGPERAPDLKLVGFSLDPPSPIKGDVVAVNVTITNNGEITAKFFRVYIYDNNILSTIASLDVNPLDVSDTRNITLLWNTSGYATGVHTLLVYVNPEFYFNRMNELSWSDNNGSRQVTISPPDLRLELVSFDMLPAEPHQGDIIIVNCTFLNNGSRTVENVSAIVYIDGKEIYNRSLDLDASERFSLTAQADTSAYTEGNHTVRLSAGNIDLSQNFTLLPLRMPDLVPRNVAYLPLHPKVGQSLAVALDAANAGDAPANQFDVALFADYSLTPVASTKVRSLGAGEAESVNLTWKTSGITAGNHLLRLVVDSVYVIAESNESNNSYLWTVAFEGDIDLALENLSFRPSSPKVGDTVQFSVRVHNIGSMQAGWANLTLKVEGLVVDRKVTTAIIPGGTRDVSLGWPTAGLISGVFNYEAGIEAVGNGTDVNGKNDLLKGQIELQPPPPAPDLRVSGISPPAQSPKVGDRLAIIISVENIGNQDAGPSTLMVFLVNGSALLKFTDPPAAVPGIPAGMSVQINVSRDTRSYRAGTYLVNATVDYNNEIHELNESNNYLSAELELLPQPLKMPSLRLEDISFEGELKEGSQVNIIATVANVGDGNAYSVKVTFTLDGVLAGNRTIDVIPPGTNRTAAFLWKPASGMHTVSARAEAEDSAPALGPQRQVTISRLPVAAKGGPDMTVVGLIIGAVAIAAAAGAAFVFMRRRKTAPAGQPPPGAENTAGEPAETDAERFADQDAGGEDLGAQRPPMQ